VRKLLQSYEKRARSMGWYDLADFYRQASEASSEASAPVCGDICKKFSIKALLVIDKLVKHGSGFLIPNSHKLLTEQQIKDIIE